MSKRLSDTEALVRQGIRGAGMCLAGDYGPYSPELQPALGSADRAVTGPKPGRFRRETGAGNESLARATEIAEEC